MFTRLMMVAGAIVTMVAATILAPPPAQAATAHNGRCEPGEFCLYYNSNQQGSLSDFTGSPRNYGTGSNCKRFNSPGSGQGRCVKNDTASVWNRTGRVVTVFRNSGHRGAIQTFTPGQKRNLDWALKNDNAGHLIGKANTPHMSNRLYKNNGKISAYFDGYLNTSGRHEGIDFVRHHGASVYSLTNGWVTRVSEGGGGLSTLAIHNYNLNRTIVYLHLDPKNALDAGDFVRRGEWIGHEDDRGSAGAPHTHVEMRKGRQTHAARSVNDYTLDNPIPTRFWRKRGYNISLAQPR